MILIIFSITCAVVAIGVVIYIINEDAKLNKQIKILKEQLSFAETAPEKFKKELEQIKEESDRLQAETSRKNEELLSKNNDLRDLVGEVRRIKEEFESKATESSQKELELTKLKVQLAKMEEQGKNVSQNSEELAHKESENRVLLSEVESLKVKLQGKANEFTLKEQEIVKLKVELIRLGEESKSALQKTEEIAVKETEINRLLSEVKNLKAELETKATESGQKEQELVKLKAQLSMMEQQGKNVPQNNEELAVKESVIKRLTDQIERMTLAQKDTSERMARFKKSEIEMFHIEKLMDEEKKELHKIKLRIQEGKMKLELIDEKTKGAVESIAQFAQGKEFEEFRKSIHMDQMIQKYEDQIKALQIKALELEKDHNSSLNSTPLVGGGNSSLNSTPLERGGNNKLDSLPLAGGVSEGETMNNENNINSFEEMVQQNSKELQCPLDIYLKIARGAVEEGSADVANLEKAIVENDFTHIDQTSHILKGVFSNLRLTSVSTPAAEINNLAREKGSIEEIKKLYFQVKINFENLQRAFVEKS
ncbi:MAG: hypothetical protein HQL12_06140 [Candidatus Omnitrophica bacterium]|nr:hypothetical protein [Candidatus Omnitrophota bacterium]